MTDDSPIEILLIEDSDDHAELVRRDFVRSRVTFKLFRAESCAAATALLETINPTLILCDYKLPDGTGLDLYKNQLKQRYPEVPIILLTSQGDEFVAVDALKSGFNDYIVKSETVLSSLPDLCRSIIRENQQKLKAAKRLEALRTSEERYRTILQTALDGVWLVGMQGQLLEVNKSYCRMSGYTEHELLTMKVADLEANESSTDTENHLRLVMEQGKDYFESRHRRKDGTFFYVDISATFQPTKGGQFVAFLRDITERKKAEAEKLKLEGQLQQSQKMEAIGTLAGGIAHDFNNILSSILGYASLAKAQLAAESKPSSDIDQVIKAGKRATSLVRQILTISRHNDKAQQPVRMQDMVAEVLTLLRATTSTFITIKSSIDAECPAVLADPTGLHQMIMNLCTNALYSLDAKDSGEHLLEVSLQSVQLDDPAVRFLGLRIKPGRFLKLKVSDTGDGMDAKALPRIFEPYYTTKQPGDGTGLGLAMVHSIIAEIGGDITVESELGVGTTFCAYLPVSEGLGSVQEPQRQVPLQGGNERILVVDDEELITHIHERYLSKLGYLVTVANDAEDALQIFAKQPNKFDLIISDVSMPKMLGTTLAKACLEIKPEIPIILCTGFSSKIDLKSAKLLGVKELLNKPVDFDLLAGRIRSILDGDSEVSPQ